MFVSFQDHLSKFPHTLTTHITLHNLMFLQSTRQVVRSACSADWTWESSFIHLCLTQWCVVTYPALHVGLVVQNGPRGCTQGTFANPLKLFSIVVSRPENKNIFILNSFFLKNHCHYAFSVPSQSIMYHHWNSRPEFFCEGTRQKSDENTLNSFKED